MLAIPIRQAIQMGYVLDSKVKVKMRGQGPVLFITFNTQQILCMKNREGKLTRVTYVWVLCRDQT